MKTYRYLYGTDLAGAYEEIFRSAGLTAYLRDQKQILGVSNMLEEIRGLYSFDKLNGYGQHPKKDIPLVVQYMPMADAKVAVWGVGGAANAGNEGVWADLSNNTGRSTTYTQLELFDLEEAAGSGNFNHLDILFGMEKLQDQDVVDARNGHRDMCANVRIEHVAPVMRQMDKEHVLAAAEALYEGKNVVFHLERGISFPYRSRELLMQLYSMLPPLFAKEIGYSCYCRGDSVKDLTRHNFRVFVVPGEEALDSRNFPERQYLILDMSSRRDAGTSELWNILESWWEMPWEERVEVMRWQFRDTDQLASTHSVAKFIATSSTYLEKLRSYNDWKAQKTFIPTGVTLEDLVDEYSRYKFWDDIPGAKETFARWSKLLLGGEEVLLDLTENAFAELTMGTDADKQRTARRQYNLGSQLCRPRGSGLQKNIQSRIDSKVKAECALVVEKKDAEIKDLKTAHVKELGEKDTEINELKADHVKELGKKDTEIKDLKAAHVKELGKKDTEIKDLKAAHVKELGEKDTEIKDLKTAHVKELGKKDTEIKDLKTDHEEKLGELNGRIAELNGTLNDKTSEIANLNKKISEKRKKIDDLRVEVGGLRVMLDGNNAATRLDWLMSIPVLGLGIKALVNHKYTDLSAENESPAAEGASDETHATEDALNENTAAEETSNEAPAAEGASDETHATEEALNENSTAEDTSNESSAAEGASDETHATDKALNENAAAEDEEPDLLCNLKPSKLPNIPETTIAGSNETEEHSESDNGGKTGKNGKPKEDDGQKNPAKKNLRNILFVAAIGLLAVVITVVILVQQGIIGSPVETTAPATTASTSEPVTTKPSESTAATTAPTESKPDSTTAPPESEFEMTPELMEGVLNAIADENGNNTKIYGAMTAPESFTEVCGLQPVALFAREEFKNNKLPKNYVMVLPEAPEKVDELYAYIDYGALHVAVNLADKGNDKAMQLAFQVFEELYTSVKYPEGIRFHARLNKYEDPVDLVFTFQKLGIEDWYLQLESWKSGDSTDEYKKDNKLKYRPYVVVEGGVEGKSWSIAYIPGDIYNDDAAEEREKLKKQYELYKTMDTGWALYLIEGQEAPAETVTGQTEPSAQDLGSGQGAEPVQDPDFVQEQESVQTPDSIQP